MKEEDFIKRVLGLHGVIISFYAIESGKEYQKIAELTEYIKYNCGIVDDKDNGKTRCKGGQNISTGCCCSGCGNTIGYRKGISQTEIPFLAKYFDEKTGYWREDKGCILPRKHRSVTCLVTKCYSIGILSQLVLNIISSATISTDWKPIFSYWPFDINGFVELLKKENGYKKPIKINK
uniref:Uncharacterized protein n=1 Tax=viral metagenome TaxID=1070528 RepID=A0A6M3JVF2_9ZZZZ